MEEARNSMLKSILMPEAKTRCEYSSCIDTCTQTVDEQSARKHLTATHLTAPQWTEWHWSDQRMPEQ